MQILRAAGLDVLGCATGRDALALAAKEQPSLLVLDIRLPDLNGFEVCSRLKSDPKTKHIPVLHVSATGEFDIDLPEALAHDSDGYLREPIEPATLVATVRALIRTAEDRDHWRRSEARYRRFLEQAYEGVWVVDGTGRTEYVNTRMAEMLKCPEAEQLIGRSAFDFVPTGDSDLLKAQFASRLASDARERYEVRLRCFDGSVLWASVSGSNVFDDEGAAVGRMALFTDITERKRGVEALRESQQRLELALEAAELGTFELDLVTRTVTASQRTCDMFGFERAPATAEDWIARIHPEDRERVASELQASISGPARFDTANRVLRQNGSIVWVVAKAVPVVDTTGHAVRLVGVAQDVTSQKQSEQVRERERDLLRAIIDNIPVMLCLYDPSLNTFEFNQEFQRVLGWSTQDANAGDFLAKVYPDPSYKRGATEYMQSLAPGWRDLNATAKNGDVVASEWANIRLADDRMIGIGIDTRERMAARDELVRAVQLHEQQFRMFDGVASTTPDFVYLFDRRDIFCTRTAGSWRSGAWNFRRNRKDVPGARVRTVAPRHAHARDRTGDRNENSNQGGGAVQGAADGHIRRVRVHICARAGSRR